jgi:AcrR family transcriptional regulator
VSALIAPALSSEGALAGLAVSLAALALAAVAAYTAPGQAAARPGGHLPGMTAMPWARGHAAGSGTRMSVSPGRRIWDDVCHFFNNGCSLWFVSSRRELLLDAAIRVLGERGVRAVTHRAVDAEAGVGAGSTANYFPTREALFEAIVERFSQRERADFDDIASTVCPTSAAELGRALAAFARDSAGPNRTLTLSRYALLVESANNTGLREQMATAGGRVSTWFANWLRLIGSADPEHDTHVVGNYITGLVLHQLAIPDPHFDPAEEIISLLETLTGTRPAPVPDRTAGLPQPGSRPDRRQHGPR